MKKHLSIWMLISSMTIFGTIGIVRRLIPISSGLLAFSRGLIGSLILFLFIFITKKETLSSISKKNYLLLFLSGGIMGFNWILLFEAYNYTSVATATLCYYMEPTLIVLASFFLFREKISTKKWICTVVSVIGMVFVSGVITGGSGGSNHFLGVILGLSAAVLYSIVVLMNQKITGVPTFTKTAIQLFSASICMIPYLLLTENFGGIDLGGKAWLFLLLVGVIHTGLAYILYFGSLGSLPTQTVAILSYIDPIVAVLLSALILKEKMGVFEIIGSIFIVGAAMISEIQRKNQKNEE